MAGQTLIGTDASDLLVGGDGDDTIQGGTGNDTIAAGAGNDYVEGDPPQYYGPPPSPPQFDDSISGGEGNDTLNGDGGPSGSPLVYGGFDTIDGGPGDDLINGGYFAIGDSLSGGPGDDTINAGATASALAGGEGDDYLHGVGTLLGGDGDDHIVIAHSGGARLGLVVLPSEHNEIDGGGGNDTIDLAVSVDTVEEHWTAIVGGYQNQSGVDTIHGFDAEGGDRFALKGVSNLIDFLQHVRVVEAGDHIDLTYDGAPFLHVFTTSAFGLNWFVADPTAPAPPLPPSVVDQVLVGAAGADLLVGGAGNDTLTSGGGLDTLFGAAGNDSITTGTGHSVVNGNQGEDQIVGASLVGDWLSGGQGNDQIDLSGSIGHNIVNGNMGSDTVLGGSGGDTLRGGQGDDLIQGGAGNDLIFGDLGDNTISGGAGADIFRTSSGVAHHTITDFNPAEGDRLAIGTQFTTAQDGVNVTVAVQGGDAFTLVGTTLQGLGPQDGWVISS